MTKHRSALLLVMLGCLISCHDKTVKKQTVSFRRTSDSSESNQAPDTAVFRLLNKERSISIMDLMSQHWELEDADKKHWNEFFWDSLRDRRIYSALYLFPDSTFTENPRTHIAIGKWLLNRPGRELILLYPGKKEKDYFISEFSPARLVTHWERNDEDLRFEFSSDNLVYKKVTEDPFHPLNNQWRIKPASSESGEQVRERVKQCVQFYALFFKDNRKRKEKNISFTGLPNCFTWYNGGIALQGTYELDKKWIECFFSEQQALDGYEMIKTVLDKHQLKWPKDAGGWIEELQSILAQIHDQL